MKAYVQNGNKKDAPSIRMPNKQLLDSENTAVRSFGLPIQKMVSGRWIGESQPMEEHERSR